MRTKIILRLLSLAICVVCVSCKTGDYLRISERDDAITLVPERKVNLLTNGRPKVVTYISDVDYLQQMISWGELDLNLLKKQISKNREFDFLIYVGGTDKDEQVLEDFVYTNKLDVLLFIDRDGSFARENCIQTISCVSLITDPELKMYGVAVVGAHLSPFDKVIGDVRRKWGW